MVILFKLMYLVLMGASIPLGECRFQGFPHQPASVNRVTVGDLLSLGEIYGFLPVHWKVSSLLLLKPIGYQYR